MGTIEGATRKGALSGLVPVDAAVALAFASSDLSWPVRVGLRAYTVRGSDVGLFSGANRPVCLDTAFSL